MGLSHFRSYLLRHIQGKAIGVRGEDPCVRAVILSLGRNPPGHRRSTRKFKVRICRSSFWCYIANWRVGLCIFNRLRAQIKYLSVKLRAVAIGILFVAEYIISVDRFGGVVLSSLFKYRPGSPNEHTYVHMFNKCLERGWLRGTQPTPQSGLTKDKNQRQGSS